MDNQDNSIPSNFRYVDTPEGVQDHYANHVQVFWSGVDVTLVFGEMTHSIENLQKHVVSIENKSQITISWSVAKLIVHSLADAVAKYEEKNGELKLPGQYEIP